MSRTSENGDGPETADVHTRDDAEPDQESDPALDGPATVDWAGEGGATSEGPATATPAESD